MSDAINRLEFHLKEANLQFQAKPILIGGMAMEYYGFRKSGADIDLVIRDADYQTLALNCPDKRRDLWGDLGVMIKPFEIWRSVARFDYDFFSKDAIDEGIVFVVSLDRLLFMKILAMDYGAGEKNKNDLQLIKNHYYKYYVNQDFHNNMEKHMPLYEKNNGVILGGRYFD